MSVSERRLDAELSAANLSAGDFAEVNLQSALDVEARIAATPAECAAKGMYFEQLARSARKLGVGSETRYVPFRDYPLRDYMRLLADYARARSPGLPLRDGIRRAGHEAFSALLSSVAGRVLFSFAGTDVLAALKLAPQAYKYSLSNCSVGVRSSSPGQVVLEFRDVWNFPDCYQVGVVEGALRAFNCQPQIRTRVHSPCHIDMLIRW